MSNPYVEYYHKQIGKGIPGFRGLRYQRGYGFLNSLIAKAIVPLFKTVTRVDPASVVKTAVNVLKSPGLQDGKPLADDIARIGATAAGALINSLQKGKGRKYIKRRRSKKKSVTKKRCCRKRRICRRKKRKIGKKILTKPRKLVRKRNKVRKSNKKSKRSLPKSKRSISKIIDALS